MIREATTSDLPFLMDVAHKFHAAGGMPSTINVDALSQFLTAMIEGEQSVIFRTDGGVIGGAIVPAYYNHSYLQAVELFWWSTDRQGRALLSEFERWAAEMGANEVRMSTIASIPKSARLLGHLKYTPSEISHRKAI